MASSSPWNISLGAGRRLAELLEEQQEPFLLEDYLMENGCSGRMVRSQATPLCWPVNTCKRLRRLGTASVFLKRTLAKLIYYSNNATSIEHGRLSVSSCFYEDSKHQLSPVSVLDLHSAESSPFHIVNESYITLEVFHEYSKSHCAEQASKYSKGRRPVLDCAIEAKERTFKKAMNELILLWERQKGDVSSLTKLMALDFSSWMEWNQFKPYVREIGLLIEAAIFDDLRTESVFDMLALH